jgi:hypothetical protein
VCGLHARVFQCEVGVAGTCAAQAPVSSRSEIDPNSPSSLGTVSAVPTRHHANWSTSHLCLPLPNANSKFCCSKLIVTRLRAGQARFNPWQKQRFLLFSTTSRSALWSTQPPVQWIARLKWPEHEAELMRLSIPPLLPKSS